MSKTEAELQAACLKGPSGIDDLTIDVTDGYDEALFHQLQSTQVTAAASAIDLTKDSVNSAYPNRLAKGGFWVSLQPIGGNIYIRFRPVSTNPATTSTTGLLIVDATSTGTVTHFWVGKNERYLDVLGTATFNLKWWRSSERKDFKSPMQVKA